MKIAFITPTKDRPRDLGLMLESFARQTREPDQVIVVDVSATPARDVVLAFADRLPVKYVRWEGKPSAAAQRNGGLKHVREDFDLVCFFDDDQVLHPDALEKMLAFWETAGPDIGGAAFNQANHEDNRSDRLKRSWFSERLGLYARRPGAVAPSGWQSLYGKVDKNTEVEWLGSGMSVFRRSILDEYRFDEFFDGYSYLEDLDFSYSVSRKHKLYVVADALFDHYQAASGRGSAYQFGKVEVRNRLYFVRKHGLSLASCFLALVLRGGISLLDGIVHANGKSLLRMFGNVPGLIQGLRHCPSRSPVSTHSGAQLQPNEH